MRKAASRSGENDGSAIDVSVVLAASETRGSVCRCLESLFAQDVRAFWEVVVVEGPATEGSVPAEMHRRAPIQIRVVGHAGDGLAERRNHGAAQSRGRILLFLDDDMVADSRLISEHLAHHGQAGRSMAVGRVTYGNGGATREKDDDALVASRSGLLPRGLNATRILGRIAGNLSATRSTFLDADGFATDLPGVEEVDLGRRLARAGEPATWLPSAVARRAPRDRFREQAADLEAAGASSVELYGRHPETLTELPLGWYVTVPIKERLVLTALLRSRVPPAVTAGAAPFLSRLLGRSTQQPLAARHAYWRGVRRAVRDIDTWRRLTGGVVILGYHAIGSDGEPASKFVVPRRTLERQMRWLRSQGRPILSVDEFLAFRREYRFPPAGAVVVTLDDGYRDVLLQAQGIFADLAIPATVFVVTNRVGSTDDWSRNPPTRGRALLDWDEVRRLGAEGLTFGAHSRSHADLLRATLDEIAEEVDGSSSDIERELGDRPRLFAYPYGRYDGRVQDALERAGMTAGFTTMPRLNGPAEPDLALRRTEIDGTNTFAQFVASVRLGDGSWINELRSLSAQIRLGRGSRTPAHWRRDGRGD